MTAVTETVPVKELLDTALKMHVGGFLRHEVQLKQEFDDVPPITTDRHKVLQILVNLLQNAKNACDESGREDKRVSVRICRGGDKTVRIEVSDNGVGIPAENLTKIFSHGFTTRKNGHGFGLHSGALAARELGGAIVVTSDGPGKGSTFSLELPIAVKT
jgi:C4-dicarboxylate-specific signal transduction histidine kinase